MYMEHSAEDSLGDVDGKKPRSLDLQTLYDQDAGLPHREKQSQKDPVKRKSSLVEDTCHVKKKSKKEVLLRSLASGKNSKKSLDEECEGGSRSGSGSGSIDSSKPEGSGQGRISDNAREIGGVSLNHGGDITQIPKRRREMIRRKKVDDNQGLKMSGAAVSSGDMLLSVELKGRLNGDEVKNSNVSTDEKINGNLDQIDMSTRNGGGDEDMKVFRTENFNNDEINRSNKSDFVRRTKKGEGIVLPKRGNSSSMKVKRNYTKRKRTGLKIKDGTVDSDPVLDQSVGSHDVSLDDNEENLEANAARMLSSRFDPSCTHFTSNNKTSRSPTPHRGSGSPRAGALSGSDTETADRVLRPRDQQRPKGVFRKRRHFYEVFARDLDPHWMLQRKTKVYWPLDQIWYYGKIIGFNPDNNLHHIRYDDQEEEWINLCNERFKLLLFPSELPYNRRRRRASKEDGRLVKKKNNVDLQENHRKTESEPIISWLSKSSHGSKSPPCATRKRQKTSKQSNEGRSPSMSLTKNDEQKCVDVGSSRKDADECSSNPSVKELPGVLDGRELSLMESSSKPPIVYVRRRFRRKEQGPGDVVDNRLSPLPVKSCGLVVSLNCDPDKSLSINQRDSSAGWFHCGGLSGSAEDLFPLKLSCPVVAEKVIRFELTRPLFLVPYYCFGLENLALLHAAQMLHYGTLQTLWPRVHLEMLFVDDVFGLSFFMFEGCLKQAVVLLFLTLNIFHRPNQEQKRDDEQLPVTSIRFRISFLGDVRKCLVLAFYNFREVGISKWNHMEGKLKKNCFLGKQLAPSECTYETIKALEYGFSKFPVASVLQESSVLGSRKRIRHCLSGDCESRADDNMKQTRIPSSPFSFVAASPFFLDLHLKLLMKRCDPYASHKDQDSIALPLHSENNNIVQKVDCSKSGSSWSSHSYGNRLGGISKSASPAEQSSRLEAGNDASCAGFEAGGLISRHCHKSPGVDGEVCLTVRKDVAAEPGKCHSSEKILDTKDHSSTVGTKTNHCLVEGIAVEILPFDPPKGQNGHKSAELANRVIVSAIPSPKASGWRGMLCQSGVGDASLLENLSPLSDRRPDLIACGPKKRRTQVSYSMPVEGQEVASKFKSNDTKGFPHKRIRRASEKKMLQPEISGNSHGKMEELYCDVNVLVIAGDHGRREDGAKVALELFDHSEWRLAVKIHGFTRYSYKAHQFLQCGSTNRYTHAMMWKGGKDWILEFPDRSQWALFKEMHEECYNRNLRAASLKTIPIPGVHLIDECDVKGVEKPFVRPSSKYYRQIQNDVDIAMDPSNVLYDMDSDDEQWVAMIRSSDVKKSGSVDLSDETFEKIMDMLEKVAFARKKDFFTCDELEDFMVGDESAEDIKSVYEYWREKRQKKGMPLIRHFQPPLWDKYQQQVKEWELATGAHEKAVTSIEKPPMYAFCMKPRGLELVNRGSKHRSQKKLSVSGSSMFPVDSETYQSFVGGRRFNGYAYGEETSLHARYNHHGFSDSSPSVQASTRMISPREMGSWGYFFSNSDANGRNLYYSKVHGTKSKKIGSSLSPIDQRQVFSPRSPRILGQRRDLNANLPPEWASPRYYYHPDGPHGINIEQLDPSDLDEFRLRDASSAAQHAVNMAKLKREKAQRLLYKADLAIHKAVVALMTAEAIKATAAAAATTTTTTTSSSSMEESNRDACSHG